VVYLEKLENLYEKHTPNGGYSNPLLNVKPNKNRKFHEIIGTDFTPKVK
jgi:hypothetical protein